MMVVACNTATCNAIDDLRAKYKFPIVGTIPAVRPAAKKTESGTIAVICTPSTSKSATLRNIIKNDCGGVNVLNIGCKNLENVVEKGELNSVEANNLLKKYLETVVDSDIDYLVLGCTHYPFLKKSIKKIVGRKVKLIDSGKAIAKRTKALLTGNNLKNNQKRKGKIVYFTTGKHQKFSKVASKLLSKKVVSKTVKI